MSRVVYGNLDELPEPIRRSIVSIDWDNSSMSGLRQAANDVVEMTREVSGNDLKKIDSVLGNAGAITLSQARDRSFRRTVQLLSSFKVIKRSEDAHLLKEIVDNQDERFSSEQLERAGSLLETYRDDA